MTENEKLNENIKLIANWMNTLATAIMAAGAFVPGAQFIFHVLPTDTDLGLVYGLGIVCFVGALILHLLGHLALRSLR